MGQAESADKAPNNRALQLPLRKRTPTPADLNLRPPRSAASSAGSSRDSGMGGRIDVELLPGPADSPAFPSAKRTFGFDPEVVRSPKRPRVTASKYADTTTRTASNEESGSGSLLGLRGGGAPKTHPAIRFPPGYQLAATRDTPTKAGSTAPMPFRSTAGPMSLPSTTASGSGGAPSTGKFPEPAKDCIEIEGDSDSDVEITGFNIRRGREPPYNGKQIHFCGKRKYGEWFGIFHGTQQIVSGHGTLFPKGYQPREGDENPWVCPICDCQAIFSGAHNLGCHFKAAHRRVLLNDNCDGTMSIVGERPYMEGVKSPAIVISQIPLDLATGPPITPPRVPGTEVAALRDPQAKSAHPVLVSPGLSEPGPNSASDTAPASPLPEPASLQSERDWRKLICRWLPDNITQQESTLLSELLSLPRRRDIPARWEARFAHNALPNFKTLCLLIVHVTGREAPVPCAFCARKKIASARAFEGCFALAEGRSKGLRSFFGGDCCNVFGMFCGANVRPEAGAEAGPGLYPDQVFAPRVPNEGGDAEGVAGVLDAQPGGSAVAEAPEVVRPVSPEAPRAETTGEGPGGEEEGVAEVRRSGRLAMREQNTLLLRRKEAEAEEARKKAEEETAAKAAMEREPISGSKTKRGQTKKLDARDALASQGDFDMGLMAVQTWERAPGIIRDETGDRSEYVAFSSAYLSTNITIRTSDDSAFRIHEIQPSNTLQWQVDKTDLRICSVAQGVVRVKIGGADEFQISLNGMWKVRRGVACSVTNPFHTKATLHVTSVSTANDQDW